MRKFFALLLSLSILLSNLTPLNAFANTVKTPVVATAETSTVTYISTVEEYESVIKDPTITLIEILEDIDVSKMTSKNEVIVDGFDRIIDFRNRNLENYSENPLTLNYQTDNDLTLRVKIGAMNWTIYALDDSSITVNGDFTPSLTKALSIDTSYYSNSEDFESIKIDGEILTLENSTLVRNDETVANFYRVGRGSYADYYLELNNYSGDQIVVEELPDNTYLHVLLSGKNKINTEAEFGILSKNTTLFFETADDSANLEVNVNSATSTAIGVAVGFFDNSNVDDVRVKKNVSLEINVQNQNSSDNLFLTGILTRHGSVDLVWAESVLINVLPNLIDNSIDTTNNLTGITTELDGQIGASRNRLTINNPLGSYGVWTGTLSFPDSAISYDSLTNTTEHLEIRNDLESPETKITYSDKENSSVNVKNINSLSFARDALVERLTPSAGILTFTLDNKAHTLNLKTVPLNEPLEKSTLEEKLTEIKENLTVEPAKFATLENMEIVQDENEDYYLKIVFSANYRHAFRENSENVYSYKNYFQSDQFSYNTFYLNNYQIENYTINSLDSLTLYYPLEIYEPKLERTLLRETPEPTEDEEIEETEDKEETEESNEPAETTELVEEIETPNTSARELSGVYYLFLVVANFGLLVVFNRRSDII